MMSMSQFVGVPCGYLGPYTFHKGFQFAKSSSGKCNKVIRLGEFFFVRISTGHDPCIGELVLLWHDRNTDQCLSSVQLYFLPEQTPDGRLAMHGQDEVLMAADKLVLRLEDLICWITDQVDWNHGLLAICSDDVETPSESPETHHALPGLTDATSPVSHDQKEEQNCDSTEPPALEQKDVAPCPVVTNAVVKTEDESVVADGELDHESSSKNGVALAVESPISTAENIEILENGDVDKNDLKVRILNFPTYCRYRTITKRLEGMTDRWMRNALVTAFGGFTVPGRNTHILFCRDSFEHEELNNHELNCEYLVPTSKVKRRKKKGKNARCTSPGSESNTSEEGKEIVIQNNNVNNHNGFKQPPCKTEQEFLQRLYNFMKKRKTPIHRVPHLGFKQIDLFVFFSFAQKLGGYDKITTKRLWKHVYDELGGDPGSTSAATCTRRHYERLLLPFERFMDGKEYKPKQSRKQKTPMKKVSEDDDIGSGIQDEKADLTLNGKVETDDAYNFTDSNQENSKDSIMNEDPQSGEDLHFLNEVYSDEDSKSIWSIQKNADMKEYEKDENKHIKPLIIQKEQNESFSEKERKWNEIRRKNALARKWVRQLRPSRSIKSSGTEDQNSTQTLSQPTSFKEEGKDDNIQQQAFKNTLPITNHHQHIKQEPHDVKSTVDSNIVRQLQDRRKSGTVSDHMNLNLSFTEENGYVLKARDAFLENVKYEIHPSKTEPLASNENVWPGYPRGSTYEIAAEKYPFSKAYMMQNFADQEQKSYMARETSTSRTGVHPSNMSDCNTTFKSETDMPNNEGKLNISQRRPSVIQHTEFVTSPSPSQSPKQLGSETFSEAISRESMVSFGSSSNSSTFKNQLSLNMAGKVSEWLAKGVPEAVACKTPSTVMTEKMGELHDKVTIPSVCKTPGPGSGKVPVYISKIKNEAYAFPNMQKPAKSKMHGSYIEAISDAMKKTSSYPSHDSLRNSLASQQAFHPSNPSMNPLMAGFRQDVKIGAPSSHNKNRQYLEPFYNQPKRPKSTHTPLTTSIQPPPRPPSLLPFSRQQTYRKSPHSDIPKTTPSSHTEYENSVLDLSVKRKQPERIAFSRSFPSTANAAEALNSDAICLDLSLKKRPTMSSNQDNAIENITPPITPSPKTVHPYSPYPSPRSSKQPALIAFQDMKKDDLRQKALHHGNSSGSKSNGVSFGGTVQSSIPLSSLAMSSNPVMFPGNAQNKLSPNFISSLPDPNFTKELSKTMYLPPDPMLLPPYVIPPFYAASWTSSANSMASTTNSTASPSSFKEAVSHGVFPKQYLYNYKNQFHPLLCKENGYYPPSCK